MIKSPRAKIYPTYTLRVIGLPLVRADVMATCHLFRFPVVQVVFFHRCAAVAAGEFSVHLNQSVEGVLVFAGEATVYLCLVTARTDWVAELVLGESFGK